MSGTCVTYTRFRQLTNTTLHLVHMLDNELDLFHEHMPWQRVLAPVAHHIHEMRQEIALQLEEIVTKLINPLVTPSQWQQVECACEMDELIALRVKWHAHVCKNVTPHKRIRQRSVIHLRLEDCRALRASDIKAPRKCTIVLFCVARMRG